MLDHVGGATVAQGVGAGGAVVALYEEPDGLAGEGHAAQGEKETCAVCGVCPGADAGEVRAAFFEVEAEGLEGGDAEGDDAFFVAFAADQDAAEVEREVGGGERGDFGDTQAAGVEQFKDGAIAEGCGAGLWAAGGGFCRLFSARKHGVHFRLGEGFGENFPGFGRVDVDGGVVVDAAVEEEPLVEAADAAELAGGGARIDAVGAEMLQERGYVLLRTGEQDAVAGFEELGEGL